MLTALKDLLAATNRCEMIESLSRFRLSDSSTEVQDPTISYNREIANSFDQTRSNANQDEILQVICSTLATNLFARPDAQVLDLGCGTGILTIPLAQRCPWAKFIGADRSQAMLDIACKKAGSNLVSWQQQEAPALDYPEESLDAVVMSNFLHHFQHPQDVIDAATRVLKPNGVLISVYGAIEDIAEDPDHAYFPTALIIDCARTPALRHVERWCNESGLFGIASHKRSLKLASNPQERIQRTKDKHVSVLHMIPDFEFQRGLESLQNAIDTIDDITWWCYQGVTITTAIKSGSGF